MQMKRTVSIVVIIVIMISLMKICLPFLFMGPALPLFEVNNIDEQGHDVHIEVLDQNNITIATEEGYIGWAEGMSHPRTLLQWLPVSHEYTIKISIDGKTETVHNITIDDPHTTVNIEINGPNEDINESYVKVELSQIV